MKIDAEPKGTIPHLSGTGFPEWDFRLDLPLSSSLPVTARSWTDEDLVEECLGGSTQAWAVIVDKHKAWVYSELLEYGLGLEDAADRFQEIWLDLYSDLGHLRAPGDVRAWLMAAVWCKCSGRVCEQAGRMSFAEWKEQAERRQAVRDAVAQLQDRRPEI